ncbi:hypothetical protein ACKKBG_A22395 [Auxenochlorella protothecoides x Auxenochlorella symbiontica]
MSLLKLTAAMESLSRSLLRSPTCSQLSRSHSPSFCPVGHPGAKLAFRQQHGSAVAAAASPAEALVDHAEPRYDIDENIGFIGAGQMGEAMIRGFLESGVSHPSRLSASVRSSARATALSRLGVTRVFQDAVKSGGAAALAASARVIFLGVKPQGLPEVLAALAPHVGPQHLVVSIAAGVRLATLEAGLGAGVRVARVMPNTPMLVGQGASAYALGSAAGERDAALVHALLSGVGMALHVDERCMDAVTGVSGSGPAYAYMMIEAMADGGVQAGLPRATALALAAKTVAGAAAMVLGEGADGALDLTHPGVLKDRVGSPGGTTIAAIAELENSGVRGAFMRAVRAAAERSAAMG